MQAVLGQGGCAADSSGRLRLFLGLEAEEGGLGRRKASQPEQQLCQMLKEGSQGCKAQLEFRGRGARRSQTGRTGGTSGPCSGHLAFLVPPVSGCMLGCFLFLRSLV